MKLNLYETSARYLMGIKLYETIARYLMGIYFLFGAVDGALDIFFNVHITGEAKNGSFFYVLQHTLFFWAFMKFIEFVGAISLLFNYKPALGVALLTPISSVLCLFYIFRLHWYLNFWVLMITNLILIIAYWSSFRSLFIDAYPVNFPRSGPI